MTRELTGEATATTPVIAAIHHRRSIREGYRADPISDSYVMQIVAAGLAAPSSKNSQPWKLHIVRDRAALAEIARDMESDPGADRYVPHDPSTGEPRSRFRSTVGDSADVLRRVSTAIFIENRAPFSNGWAGFQDLPAERLKSALFAYALENIGVGAAVENMWLAAESLGLRAAFLGDAAIATPTVNRLLGLTGEFAGVLVLGRSDSRPRPPMDVPDGDESTRAVWYGEQTIGSREP